MEANPFFALALEHLLKQRGWGSVSTLALESGLSQPQITRIKKGKSTGSVEAREKIAKALGTTVEEMLALGRILLKGEDRRHGPPGRRITDTSGYPHLQSLVVKFPAISRYVEMAELAAAEGDSRLVLNLMRTVLEKFEEELDRVDSPHSGDDRQSLGGA